MKLDNISAMLPQITPRKICGVAVLTWLFSAMQCNSEYRYTTNNPIAQVMLSLALASGAVLALSSQAVSQKVHNGIDYCRDNFFAKSADKKSATTNSAKSASLTAETLEQVQDLSRKNKQISEETVSNKAVKSDSSADEDRSIVSVASTQPGRQSESNLSTPSSDAHSEKNPSSPVCQ